MPRSVHPSLLPALLLAALALPAAPCAQAAAAAAAAAPAASSAGGAGAPPAGGAGAPPAGAAGAPQPEAAFFSKHCYDCHDHEEHKGGLDLTALPWPPVDQDAVTRWVKIHDRVAAGEMPPPKKP